MIFPTFPSLTAIRSTEATGLISQPVPTKNTSSVRYNSVLSITRSVKGIFSFSSTNTFTVSRVTLSRMSLVIGGIITFPWFVSDKYSTLSLLVYTAFFQNRLFVVFSVYLKYFSNLPNNLPLHFSYFNATFSASFTAFTKIRKRSKKNYYNYSSFLFLTTPLNFH